jgi:thymidylate synthase (FAD)
VTDLTVADFDSLDCPKARVLDHGFVALLDHMGDDSAIVRAARISTGKGTKSPAEDRGLIRYLVRNHHTTPLEMVEFKFLVKCPMFVWRQWIRHRTASVNEVSGRYTELPDETFHPSEASIRKQGTLKQGRTDEAADSMLVANFRSELEHDAAVAFANYRRAVEGGIAKEIARVGLPLSTYTVAYWKIDLNNLFRFLGLRLDPHAQEEIRVYAEAMAKMVRDVCPVAYEAFEDYQLNAMTLSALDVKSIRDLLTFAGGKKVIGNPTEDDPRVVANGQYDQSLTFDPSVVEVVLRDDVPGKSERTELLGKMKALGFVVREKS